MTENDSFKATLQLLVPLVIAEIIKIRQYRRAGSLC
jgi:hypothetical protein